jgi:hypothetical protein
MDQAISVQAHSSVDRRQIAASVAGSLVGGMVGGIAAGMLARASMRSVALLSPMLPSFTVEGTLFILALGLFLGGLAGLLYGLFLPFTPERVSLKTIAFGVLVSGVLASSFILIESQRELALALITAGLAGLVYDYFKPITPGSVRVKGLVFGLVTAAIFATILLLNEQQREDALILLIGVMVPLIYGFLQWYLPGSVRVRGFLFGLLVSVIFAAFALTTELEGEATLVSPVVFVALFVPVVLIYGLLLGLVSAWLIPKVAAMQWRSLLAVIIAAFLPLVLLIVVGIANL